MTVLSKRLKMLADMVTPGNRLADIGCDHGFLDIYLVRKGICPGALAMDVREGPLASARKHVNECGLGDYIKVRLSDGLSEYEAGEADTLVCAGMGGRLMEKIITEGMDKARQAAELILQPQSELPEFRIFLRNAGFAVTAEDAVYEDGKYYFAMKAIRAEVPVSSGAQNNNIRAVVPDDTQRLYDLYGELLLKQRNAVLLKYLAHRSDYIKKLEASLAAADTGKARIRLEEVRKEFKDVENALKMTSSN